MRYLKLHVIVLSLLLFSCGVDIRDLGGNFVLYRDEATMRFTSIGLELSGGGTQGLLDGAILSYGFDEKYVVVRFENDQHYYFEKKRVSDYFEKPHRGKDPQRKVPVLGPVGIIEFRQATTALGLPPLTHQVPTTYREAVSPVK